MSRKQLTNMYLSTLCLELHMLHSAGVTAVQGVQMMLDDEPHPQAARVLQALLPGLENGLPLSQAMAQAGFFPAYLVNMLATGEKTGRIPETLQALSHHYERQEKLATAIKNATLYPAVLLGLMLGVMLLLVVQVLPIFNEVFGRMGAQMSPLAQQLMALGMWLRGAGAAMVVGGLAVFAVALAVWMMPRLREKWARTLRHRCGAWGVFGRVATYRFVSSMSLAMASGLDLQESVGLAAALNSDTAPLADKYNNCLALLRSGHTLSAALREGGILTARDSRMLAIGDTSGMADHAMAEIARRTDQQVQAEISSLVSRIEPTLVIITAVMVGVILLSVMLPLMGIMAAIG